MNKIILAAACAAFGMLDTRAISLTLGGGPGEREATLDSADSGYTGSGNATAAIVQNHTGGAAWTPEGAVAANTGSGGFVNGSLTINVTTGSFGEKIAGGTWTINDANFWTTYSEVAISLHVGNGPASVGPDHFVWLISQNQLSGTWSYDGSAVRQGGGLSNLHLYGRGDGTQVPEGGATALTLGLALAGLRAFRKSTR